ncbi:unnamed protein product, partial [Owenia fusiformis]
MALHWRDEFKQQLSILTGTSVTLPQPRLIQKYFETAVNSYPGEAFSKGIWFNDQFMNYYDIEALSQKAANHLQHQLELLHKAPRNGEIIIAIDIEPCHELIIAILAIFKIGAAYLPLDSRSPPNRIKHVITEANPTCVVVPTISSKFIVHGEHTFAGLRVFSVDELLLKRLNSRSSNEQHVIVNDAYVKNSAAGPVGNSNGNYFGVFEHLVRSAQPALISVGKAIAPIEDNVNSKIDNLAYEIDRLEHTDFCDTEDDNVFEEDTEETWEILNTKHNQSDDDVNAVLDENEREQNNPLACIIYTSGSTGFPKGVRIRHKAVLNRLVWQWIEFPFKSKEFCCFKTSLLFVDSVIEIFSCVLKLIPMVISPREITKDTHRFLGLLNAHKVSRLIMVPSMLQNILSNISKTNNDNQLSHLTLWMSNSETLPMHLLQKFFRIFPVNKTFANLYGSTETMADVTYERYKSMDDVLKKSCDDVLSIGRPMCNSFVYIVDDTDCIVPVGETGELWASGLHIADGYVEPGPSRVNTFMRNPFIMQGDHTKVYKTGDFGRVVNGVIIYEGRKDTQVKVHGQRVHIAEIEKAVMSHQSVDQVTVLCHEITTLTKVIVAYFTLKKTYKLDIGGIITECKSHLPYYMIPRLVNVETLPLQPHTGKIDRAKLQKFYNSTDDEGSFIEHMLPADDTDCNVILETIASNIHIPRLTLTEDANFFELGGNSVNMVSTIVQLREKGYFINVDTFSECKTIGDILKNIKSSLAVIPNDDFMYDNLEIVPLRKADDNERIMGNLSINFTAKEPLCRLLSITKDDFMPLANVLYSEAIKTNLSFVVLDKQSKQILGGDFLFDYANPIQTDNIPSMEAIFDILATLEQQGKPNISKRCQKLLYNNCLCVDMNVDMAHQVKLCHVIEDHVIQVARANGFDAVVTHNTNQ